MEGALPLGVTEDAEFPVMQLALQPGDRLTLLTDGIVEAQNETRELFGFARISELMRQHKSAVEIAAAAQSFGQNDDITVLRVEFKWRTPAGAGALRGRRVAFRMSLPVSRSIPEQRLRLCKNLPIPPVQLATMEIESRNWPRQVPAPEQGIPA